MSDTLIMFIMGLVFFILGLLFLKREAKLFEDSVVTSATVVTYDEDMNYDMIIMYTMVVEYKTIEGGLIRAKEQSSSSSRRYPVGKVISISYSKQKPDFFAVYGDYSRKLAMLGMIIMGLILMILTGYLTLKG